MQEILEPTRRDFLSKSALALFGFMILPGAGRVWKSVLKLPPRLMFDESFSSHGKFVWWTLIDFPFSIVLPVGQTPKDAGYPQADWQWMIDS